MIDKVKGTNAQDKVILIGHNMGGLAAREYLQSSSYDHDVAKLITVGTPHRGSFLADLFTKYKNGEITHSAYVTSLALYYGPLVFTEEHLSKTAGLPSIISTITKWLKRNTIRTQMLCGFKDRWRLS